MAEPRHPIGDVRFRQQLRGYSMEDVDGFVQRATEVVDQLLLRVDAAERRAAEVASAAAEVTEVEESMRRTLVLAQRTADLAIKEARDEAAALLAEAEARRAGLEAEFDERRAALVAAIGAEEQAERESLYARREALESDVAALEAHLAQERERLRIYFSDQLQRIEQGIPGVAPAPTPQAPPAAAPVAETAPDEAPDAAGEAHHTPDDELDDPFLAELRRAVADQSPLGPRDDEPLPPRDDDDTIGMFGPEDDEGGRFGARLRRRR